MDFENDLGAELHLLLRVSKHCFLPPAIWCLNTAPTADTLTPLQTIVRKAMWCFCEVQRGARRDAVGIPLFLEEPGQ